MIVHVVGAGLIGTSIGLALHGRADVWLSDADERHVETAVQRGAGAPFPGGGARADLLVACVPPTAVADVLRHAVADQRAATYSHVSSVQSHVQVEAEAAGVPAARLCASHPLAGRERGGPEAATARLFADRPWVLCPSAATERDAHDVVRDLVVACGARPVEATPETHDAAVALVSHLPQVAASAVAARLFAHRDDHTLPPWELAGPGVQDTTRIAASDPALWLEVLAHNANRVAPLVQALADDLAAAADALQTLGTDATGTEARGTALDRLRDLLVRGNAGRALLPAKAAQSQLTALVVSVPDRPNQLAQLLTAAGEAGVNVEDVRVEHLPGRARGLVELDVQRDAVDGLRQALSRAGWDVVAAR